MKPFNTDPEVLERGPINPKFITGLAPSPPAPSIESIPIPKAYTNDYYSDPDRRKPPMRRSER